MTMRKITELRGASVQEAVQVAPDEVAFALTDGRTTSPVQLPPGPEGRPGRDGANVLPTLAAVNQAVYDVAGPTGSATGDVAAVIEACETAQAAGREVVRLAPGHYQLTGLAVPDIHHRYLVGDGVTFSAGSFVYPFSSTDWAGREATRGIGGGRGRVAIQVDDGLDSHWAELFPLTKRLGITVSTAWHTGQNSPWITEAHRHGWEIEAHLPENITATEYLNRGTLEAVAASSLDRIEAMIGTREGIGFVYPQHVRSAETDRVLSKYYIRGRGVAGSVLEAGEGGAWLKTALPLDNEFAGGAVSATVRQELRRIAASNASMVFYMHWDGAKKITHTPALTEFVRVCRDLGIEIVNPSQIWGDRNIIPDPYFSDASRWAPANGASFTLARAYHGDRSVELAPAAAAAIVSVVGSAPVSVPSVPGNYTVWRASVRYSVDADRAVTGTGQGFYISVAPRKRRFTGEPPASAPLARATRVFPVSGTTIPAAQWARFQDLIYLGPDVQEIGYAVYAQNVSAGLPLYVDEFKLERVDTVPMASFRGVLAGTGNVVVWTGVPNVAEHAITITPDSTPVGRISYTVSGSNQLVVKSTDAADTMGFTVSVTPRGGSYSGELSSTGA